MAGLATTVVALDASEIRWTPFAEPSGPALETLDVEDLAGAALSEAGGYRALALEAIAALAALRRQHGRLRAQHSRLIAEYRAHRERVMRAGVGA